MKLSLLMISLCVAFYADAKPKHKHMAMIKDDLAAFWNMGQDPALFPIHDRSHNGNHLTGVNFDPDLTPPGSLVDGKLGKAIQFDGVSQFLNLASNAGVNHNGGDFTVALWFKPIALAHAKRLIGSVDWGVNVVLDGGQFYVNVSVEEGSLNLTAVPLEVDEWYFLAFGWYDGGGTDTFTWGSINMTTAAKEFRTAWSDPAGAFTIGGTSGGAWINAVIDDTAIWRRRVSANELSLIYNDGDGLPFEQWDVVTPCREITCCP